MKTKSNKNQDFFNYFTQSSSDYISNAYGKKGVIEINNYLIPYTVASYGENVAYTSSSIGQYLDFVQEEINNGSKYSKQQKVFSKIGFNIIRVIPIIKTLEKSTFINNYLCSTNLYYKLNQNDIKTIKDQSLKLFPKNAIVFRSVNESMDYTLYNDLSNNNFIPIACRQNYSIPPRDTSHLKKRPNIRDKKLWEKLSTKYEWSNPTLLTKAEAIKIISLYKGIYIEKYSKHNPLFTPEAIQKLCKKGIFSFWILKDIKTKKIVGIQAVSTNDQQLTTPFIGYDTSLPKEEGIYRLLNYKMLTLAKELDLTYNMSSGASAFKKQRGGQPSFEYNMVYVNHLNWYRKLAWKMMYWVSENVTKPQFKKLEI